ncbi:hypothetical protein ACKAV7_012108 [Fusarium commune]
MRLLYAVSLVLSVASATSKVRLTFILDTVGPITRGNFTVGDATYAIHPDPVFSGGPSCLTDVDSNSGRICIYCTKLWWDHHDVVGENTEDGCFGRFPEKEFGEDYYPTKAKAQKSPEKPKLERRCERSPSLDGSGWPHQRYFFRQVSEVVQCGKNQSCSVGSDKGHTKAFGFTSTVSTKFSSYGFSVTDSYTVGSSYTCTGSAGDKICVWYMVAHTAYTVRNPIGAYPWKGCDKHGMQFIMAAPNQNNDGGSFLCKVNEECRSMHDEYWDCYGNKTSRLTYCPPPGHPERLDPDPGYLPQCLEKEAANQKREKEKKMVLITEGNLAWNLREARRKKYEDGLKRQEKARRKKEKELEDREKKRKKKELEAIRKAKEGLNNGRGGT